jgi:hypothetical protein
VGDAAFTDPPDTRYILAVQDRWLTFGSHLNPQNLNNTDIFVIAVRRSTKTV